MCSGQGKLLCSAAFLLPFPLHHVHMETLTAPGACTHPIKGPAALQTQTRAGELQVTGENEERRKKKSTGRALTSPPAVALPSKDRRLGQPSTGDFKSDVQKK